MAISRTSVMKGAAFISKSSAASGSIHCAGAHAMAICGRKMDEHERRQSEWYWARSSAARVSGAVPRWRPVMIGRPRYLRQLEEAGGEVEPRELDPRDLRRVPQEAVGRPAHDEAGEERHVHLHHPVVLA